MKKQNNLFARHNERGSTLLYATLSLCFLGMMGAAIVPMATADSDASANNVSIQKAEFASFSGLEYAYRKILAEGQDPNGTTLTIGDSTFTITSDPATNHISSVGRSDVAMVTHEADAAYASNCFELTSVGSISFSGGSGGLYDIGFQETCTDPCLCGAATNGCPESLTIDSMTISWTNANAVANASAGQTITSISIVDDATATDTPATMEYEQRTLGDPTLVPGWTPQLIGSPTGGASNGQEIDFDTDFVVQDNGTYFINAITMRYVQLAAVNYTLVASDVFTLTVKFSDGSTVDREIIWNSDGSGTVVPVDTSTSECSSVAAAATTTDTTTDTGVAAGDTPSIVAIGFTLPSTATDTTTPGTTLTTTTPDFSGLQPGTTSPSPLSGVTLASGGSGLGITVPADTTGINTSLIGIDQSTISGSVSNTMLPGVEVQHGSSTYGFTETVGTIDAGTQTVGQGGTTTWITTGVDTTNMVDTSTTTQNLQNVQVMTNYTNTYMNMVGH